VTAEPTLEPPPAAVLVSAGTEERGVPGGYSWRGGTESAPWLPAAALEPVVVAAGTVQVRVDAPVERWTARVAAIADTSGARAVPLASGDAQIEFETPARGTWVVAVEASFASAAGNAIYYWEVVVR
jgi:hypothetical protein